MSFQSLLTWVCPCEKFKSKILCVLKKIQMENVCDRKNIFRRSSNAKNSNAKDVEKREKRTKHASLVLGESQLNAGAPEMERSEGSANAFDVSRRRSTDFIFSL